MWRNNQSGVCIIQVSTEVVPGIYMSRPRKVLIFVETCHCLDCLLTYGLGPVEL